MKTNFDISLPTIPGKTIKFKIQDIKAAAFGSQKARFPDNKSGLTKKFIDSFNNFHPTKEEQQEMETIPETEDSRINPIEKNEILFRTMVAEHKKYLLPKYTEFRKTETSNGIQSKFKGGYTFIKSQKKSIFMEQKEESVEKPSTASNLTDNYYFTQVDKKNKQKHRSRREKPSAPFKNETRDRVYGRMENTVPGPGFYFKDKPRKRATTKEPVKGSPQKDIDYKHLKEVITKIVAETPEEQQQEDRIKPSKNDHVFVIDDRDRFGNQIYPIAPKLNVPGPGSYETNDTMQERAKKAVIVEEQRKLLKEWFNN